MHRAFLALYRWSVALILAALDRPHDARSSRTMRMLRLLAWLDEQRWLHPLIGWAHDLAFVEHPLMVGGVRLRHPLILAAGFVKGEGFADEASAAQATHRNIIPGWRSMPLLVGAVEFGSFTRYPRLGNPGVVLWRDPATRSTQNRVGLKNPGAARRRRISGAAPPRPAADLRHQRRRQPRRDRPRSGMPRSARSAGRFPRTRRPPSVVHAQPELPQHRGRSRQPPDRSPRPVAVRGSRRAARCASHLPLWVKISPDLADEQYRALLRAFAETGVSAVIATNTLAATRP